ncbi:hypothetical protein V3C99_011741 [Haemonchus contortus]
MFPLITIVVLCAAHALQSQIVADCDLEFASLAFAVIQPYVYDPLRLSQIEAILSSCNKSRIQKMTEVSVLLFDGSISSAKLISAIRIIAQRLTEARNKRLEQLRNMSPSSIRKPIDDTSRILANSSLSGNEKLTYLTNTINALPPEHRRPFEVFLNSYNAPSSLDPQTSGVPTVNVSDHSSVIPFSVDSPRKVIRPRSFPVQKDGQPMRGLEENFSGNERFPQNDVLQKSFTLPLIGVQDQSFQQTNTVGQNWFAIPPTIHDYNNPGGRLIDVMTKNRRTSSESTSYGGMFNDPIRAMVSNNGRPQSVGVVMKHTEPRKPLIELEDSDLLKPGGKSILSHTVEFLTKAIPLIRSSSPQLAAPSSPRFSSPYTFPFADQPQQSSQTDTSKQTLQSDHRFFLPSRDDARLSTRISVSPPHNVKSGMELDGYDTKLGRFAGGVANSVFLPSVPALPVREMVPNKTPNHNPLLPKSIRPQKPRYNVYPDHREGLFPEAVNQARYEGPQMSSPTPGPTTWSGQQDRGGEVKPSTNRETMSIENFPPPPYETAPRPKQTIGHDLLETDRLGSWPMGRFDKDEPRYATPEPKRDSTTVIAVLQERTTKAAVPLALTFIPETTTTALPPFRPYIGPEHITGSHMAREVYNIRHHGKPRFVKIDLLNE